ncbi:MAG: acyl carrier protein [Candidatus Omnitrophica bacterium]|nr:acyl carrier protein [Candidatus Omnitrophota bacterium]
MNLEQRVIKIIEENLEEKSEVTVHTNLREGLGLDSFGMVIIVNALEDEFGVSIEDHHYKGINSVADIISALKQYSPNLRSFS